jgi:hypothetical protein
VRNDRLSETSLLFFLSTALTLGVGPATRVSCPTRYDRFMEPFSASVPGMGKLGAAGKV